MVTKSQGLKDLLVVGFLHSVRRLQYIELTIGLGLGLGLGSGLGLGLGLAC